ncbi:MAG: glycosyltransferase [Nanoarchaeota archaeon]
MGWRKIFLKKAEPLVSIIMPARNSEKFIAKAIKSVLDQNYKNIELIVVDDASTDNTYNLAKIFSESNPKITLIRNRKKLGIPKSRNIALNCSRGKYVGHLDADDYLKQTAVKRTVKIAEKNKAALVYSNYIKIDENKKVTKKIRSPKFDSKRVPLIGWRHFGMYTKEAALAVGGFNEKLITCSDGDLFVKIAKQFTCQRIDRFLYYYRLHSNNVGLNRPHCSECKKNKDCAYYTEWRKI